MVGSGGRAIGWRDVLRVLERDEVRERALGQYRGAGFTPDGFRERPARDAMCHVLTRLEDWLELVHPRWPEREAVRGVRRALERELV